MDNFFQYLIEVNIYLVLFYGFYLLLLRNETFFNLNRAYLLAGAMLSFLIPVMHSDWVKSLFITEKVRETTSIVLRGIVITGTQKSGWTSLDLIFAIYLTGAAFYLVRFIWQLIKIKKIFRQPNLLQAFSFFNKIHVDSNLTGSDTIIKHEQVHVRHAHTADLLLFELISMVNWFNPIIYLYKQTLKYIHEYVADEIAAEEDKKHYAILLLSNSLGVSPNELINSFYNQSFLKRRIVMLQKIKSKKAALLKYGLSAPLFVGMLILSSSTLQNQVEHQVANSPQLLLASDVPESSHIDVKKLASIKYDHLKTNLDTAKKLSQIDVQPQYPGGLKNFYTYIGSHLKYTPEATKNGAAGKIVLGFIIDKEGSLTDIKVLKDIGYGMGEEAVRVVKEAGKWKPGQQKGRAVKVAYTLPITLNAKSDNINSPADQLKTPAKEYEEVSSIKGRNGEEVPVYIIKGREWSSVNIKSIDPSQVERIDVLKDSAAVAKFGERGKNGVVYITLYK